MDIAAASVFAQQQALGQMQLGQSMVKANANSEQKTAAILAQAVDAAGSSDGMRGTRLDISV